MATKDGRSGRDGLGIAPALSSFSQEEELTPVCNNLMGVFLDHWDRNATAYTDFFLRLHLGRIRPSKMSVSQSAGKFVKSIHEGGRGICWCPKGVSLFGMCLYPYFAVQQTVVAWETDRESIPPTGNTGGRSFSRFHATDEDAWIAYATRRFHAESEYRERLRDSQYPKANSDFFERVSLPSAVQMAYLVAWLIEQQDVEMLSLLSSPDVENLSFFRTSTMPNGHTVVGMAYVPDRALIFRGFRTVGSDARLKTLDAFILL